jgi:hypothetical protein
MPCRSIPTAPARRRQQTEPHRTHSFPAEPGRNGLRFFRLLVSDAERRCLTAHPSRLFDATVQIFAIAPLLWRSVDYLHVGFYPAWSTGSPLLSAQHLCLFWRSHASPVTSQSSPLLYAPTARKHQAGGFLFLQQFFVASFCR